ncbi:hypothetical protein Ocin01_04991 [Orchesella cincta]|uniref:Uncharacterized protein n=1 Tax=Orchesella cincta TaxID=48709 RepID=A0A1D2N8X5_ORCCI|nr:hypothetical protein Ocin01_04991 [Orchesella cincta]
MPLSRCTCKMDQPGSRCRYHREHNFDVSSLEILARGRVSPDLLQSPNKRHVSSPSNQQNSSFTFEEKSPSKGQPPKKQDMETTYQKDFCRNSGLGVNIPIQNGK